LGLATNLFGLYAFHHHGHGHSHGPAQTHDDQGHGHSHESHGHSHGHHSHDHSGHSHTHHDKNHHDENLHGKRFHGSSIYRLGVFVHILADTLGSVSVICSTILIWLFDFRRSDPLFSMIVAGLIIYAVLPLLKSTSAVLLQRAPNTFETNYDECFAKVTSRCFPGLTSLAPWHSWGDSVS
jgi:zinc transporter 5/7